MLIQQLALFSGEEGLKCNSDVCLTTGLGTMSIGFFEIMLITSSFSQLYLVHHYTRSGYFQGFSSTFLLQTMYSNLNLRKESQKTICMLRSWARESKHLFATVVHEASKLNKTCINFSTILIFKQNCRLIRSRN